MSASLYGPRAMPTLVLVLALGILGSAVMAGYRHLHQVLRAQLVNRDGEILSAVAQPSSSTAHSPTATWPNNSNPLWGNCR